MGDAPLLHYAVFLFRHGLVPYRDVLDPNMPGAYFVEWVVMRLFGPGALAWRLFDLALMCGMTGCMIAICAPEDWFAGFFAGAVLTLIHGRDGLIELGQRDLVIAALIMAAYACLFSRVRAITTAAAKTELVKSAAFGLCLGLASSIKPTALLLAPLLLILSAVALCRRGRPATPHLLVSIAGIALPGCAMLAWLVHLHAFAGFLHVTLRLVPYHAQMWRHSTLWLARNAISSVMLPLVLAWLPLAVLRKPWSHWERAALLFGVAFGILSFILQGKGYCYHRYPSEACLLVLISLDCTSILRDSTRSVPKLLAFITLALGATVVGAGSARQALRYDWHDQEYDAMLEHDLRSLGGQNLSNHIQCLDMASGCLDTLLNMNLVQSTGTLYDCYLFWPDAAPAGQREKEYDRQQFWNALVANPPQVFIANAGTCAPTTMHVTEYERLARWPKFSQYLSTNYTLVADRHPPDPVLWARDPAPPTGYRLYVRRAGESPLPGIAPR